MLASGVGLLVMRDTYQRLHYVTPVALVAPVLVGLAVLTRSGWTESSSLTWLALLFVDHRRAVPDPRHDPGRADQGDRRLAAGPAAGRAGASQDGDRP